MDRLVYLDNSATTKPCDEAKEAVLLALQTEFGNPSSLYELGINAENIVSSARTEIADMLFCREDEVFFTSCGSESNNTAIFGAARLMQRYGRHIVTTTIEHPSVLEPLAELEKQGFEVTRIKPDSNGEITAEAVEGAVRQDTVLVSMMLVNNEVGALLPLQGVKAILKQRTKNALLHVDAVQAFGKIEVDASRLSADLISISGHKLHGIKGAGALYVKRGLRLPPLIFGGGQEKGLRSGTEAVPAIAAMGAAVSALPALAEQQKHAMELKSALLDGLADIKDCVINSPKSAVPYILNFSIPGYRSETVLHFLEQRGICVSSGSACSKGKGSYVLREMGYDRGRVDSAIRVSFSRFNTLQDIKELLTALEGVTVLKKSVK